MLEAWVRVSQEVFSTSLFHPTVRKSLEWLHIKFKIMFKVFPILHGLISSPPPQLLYATSVLATLAFFFCHVNVPTSFTAGSSPVMVPLLAPLSPASSDDSLLFLLSLKSHFRICVLSVLAKATSPQPFLNTCYQNSTIHPSIHASIHPLVYVLLAYLCHSTASFVRTRTLSYSKISPR